MRSSSKLIFIFGGLLLVTAILYLSMRSSSDSVIIGKQEWMKKNLDVTTFRNGEPIPEAASDEAWREADKNKQPAWCYYNNDEELGKIYGKLYNQYAVLDPRGLAPEGWHIASAEEWDELIDFCGGKELAGDALKEAGTEHWTDPNDGATNSSGFTALPAGTRTTETAGIGGSEDLGTFGIWWTSSHDNGTKNTFTAVKKLAHFNHRVASYELNGGIGLSVRCVKDR